MSATFTCSVCNRAINGQQHWVFDEAGNMLHIDCDSKPPRQTPAFSIASVTIPPSSVPTTIVQSRPLEYASPKTFPWQDYMLSICVCKCEAPYYLSMDPLAKPAGTLRMGALISLRKAVQQNGVKRLEALFLNGATIYVPPDMLVHRIRGARLQASTIMYAMPDATSLQIAKLVTRYNVILVDRINAGAMDFFEIRDARGRPGYINAKTPLQKISPKNNTAGMDIAVGASLCIIGLMITLGGYSAASNGGIYRIFWGPVIYGAIRLFKGFSRLGENEPPATLLQQYIARIVEDKSRALEQSMATFPDSPKLA